MIETLAAPTTRAVQQTRDLPSLTSLRALAALGVFAYHVGRWDVAREPGFSFGYAGVAFFFVLSGFVLTWGYAGRLSAGRFYIRRIARIYPSHATVWAIAFLVPVTFQPIRAGTALLNLLLLQAWVPSNPWAFSMNGVSWTLSCEMAFYAAFPFVVRWAVRQSLRTVWLSAASAFAVASLVVLYAPGIVGGMPMSIAVSAMPLVRFPEFLLGIAAALSLRAGVRMPKPRYAVPVLAVCLVGIATSAAPPHMDVWLAPFFVVLVWWAAQRDCAARSGLLADRRLIYAGKVSFAFYLVHELVIINVRHLTGPGWGTAALAFVVSAAAAVCLHQLVEIPTQKAIVTRFGARRRTSPSEAIEA